MTSPERIESIPTGSMPTEIESIPRAFTVGYDSPPDRTAGPKEPTRPAPEPPAHAEAAADRRIDADAGNAGRAGDPVALLARDRA